MAKQIIKQTLSFSSFTEQKAIRLFDLEEKRDSTLLDDWFKRASKLEVTEEEEKSLDKLLAKSKLFMRGWNEDELKWKFIGPLIELVNFDNFDLEIVAFSERPLSIKINGTEIKGIVDLVVASGIFAPEQPFFFIQVPITIGNKKEQDHSGDAVGQLLSAMAVAQELNKQPKPTSLFNIKPKTYDTIALHGVYVIGRLWFFTKLEGHSYTISKAYDSLDKADLLNIFKILKAQKDMILEFIVKK